MATSGIVVSHGHARELESSLPALAPQVDELLVVANIPGSLPAELQGARVIENERPRSYSANLNAAVARTTGELVLVCNPDAVAEPEAVQVLAAFADAHPRCGVAGPHRLPLRLHEFVESDAVVDGFTDSDYENGHRRIQAKLASPNKYCHCRIHLRAPLSVPGTAADS